MALDLTIRLRADGRGLTGTLRSGGQAVQRYGRQLDTARTRSLALAKSSGTLIGTLGSLKRLLPALGFALLIQNAAQAAEEIRGLEARVSRATETLGDYTRVQRELYETSQRNGTVLLETSNLFVSINRAAEELGRSRGEVLQLTDTIQQLGVISGASGEAMKNSLRQFSQAMAGGVVRAEEFNSIIENTPEIAARIAKGMDTTVGKLRLAVVEGEVLSESVFSSLLKQTDEIRADFDKMPLTINRAWTALTNSMSSFVALGNEATGVTSGVAGGIKSVSESMDELNEKIRSGEFAEEWRLWREDISAVGDAIDVVTGQVDSLMPDGLMEFWRAWPAMARVGVTSVIAFVHQWAIDAERRHDLLGVTLAEFWDWLVHKAELSWLKIKQFGAQALDALSLGTSDLSAGVSAEIDAVNAAFEQGRGRFDAEREAINRRADTAIAASNAVVDSIRDEQFARVDAMHAARESARWLAEEQRIYDELMGSINDDTEATRRNTQAKGENAEKLKETQAVLDELESDYRELFRAVLAEEQQLRDNAVALAQSLETETETINREYNERLALLDQAQSQGVQIVGGYQQARERLHGQMLDRLTALEENQANEYQKIWDNMLEGIQSSMTEAIYNELFQDGIDSWGDFMDSIEELAKRAFANVASAWVTSGLAGIFSGKGLSGFSLDSITGGGGLGGLINGGGIGGAIGQGTGIAGAVTSGSLSQAISGGITKGIAGIKSFLGIGGTSTAGAFGLPGVNPATMASGSGLSAGFGGFAGVAVPLAIGAYGFGVQARKQAERRERQQEFFQQVGTGTREQLGDSAWDFRGMLNDAEAFFSTTREGWQSTIEALHEADVATKGWGASLDENGQGLVKVQGDVQAVKAALSSATATGYSFVGSLTNAIEKGNSLRVNIQGDADAISAALDAATAMGIGGFRALETTGTGVTAVLTGDIARWDEYLQGFVNSSVRDAVSGVNAIGSAFANVTRHASEAARAASQVRVGSTVRGGRSAQVDGSHETGLDFVPFDDYFARLHRGERVLTARENRFYSTLMSGGAPPISASRSISRGSATPTVEDPSLAIGMRGVDGGAILVEMRDYSRRTAEAFEGMLREQQARGRGGR